MCDQFSQVKVCRERDVDCAVSSQISCRPCQQPIEKKKDRQPSISRSVPHASRRCLSAALVNPHQAGEAYSNLWTLFKSDVGLLIAFLEVNIIFGFQP